MSKRNRRDTNQKKHNIEDVRVKMKKNAPIPAEKKDGIAEKIKKYFLRLIQFKAFSWAFDQLSVIWEWICNNVEKLLEHAS